MLRVSLQKRLLFPLHAISSLITIKNITMTTATIPNVPDQLFSSPLFRSMDTEALLQQFDPSSAIRNGNTTLRPKVTPVTLTDALISSIPSQGLLITLPGRYQFANDIIWNPAAPGSAITIQTDNVVLDLNGHSLIVNVPTVDMTNQYNGICIRTANDTGTVNAVTIQNGTINGASYYGVCAMQTTNLRISDLTTGNISYTETTMPDLTPCGIFIDTADTFKVHNCIVQHISVTAPSCAGIQVISSANGSIFGCTMRHFLNKDGGVQGFSYLKSSNIVTNACIAQDFQSHYLGRTTTTGHTVIGYVPIFCAGLEFNDCSAADMRGCCDDCHGMSVFLDIAVEVNNFSAANITDGLCPANTGAKATGLEVYGDYITLNDCTAENITAIVPQDLQGAGFSAWGNHIIFNNCTAKNVVVTDANHVPSTQYGYGAGFGWAPDPRTEFCSQAANHVQYNNCNAYNCQLGFDTWYHTNSRWHNVMAYDCGIFILAQPDTATRTLSMDKCSESPSGKYEQVTLTNIAAGNTYPQIHIA